MGFNSKYKSGKSVGKNQTVPISVDDPRLKPGKIGQTKARQGAEIDIVGLDGKSLILGGNGLNSPAGKTNPVIVPDPVVIIGPPIGQKPPKTYPGGSGPIIIVPTDPTNVTAEWVNNDLVISFDWDYANDSNYTVTQFIVQLTSGGVTKRSQSNIFIPNTTQTRQTITVTKSIITSMFNVFRTSFSAVCVLTADPLNNISNTICAASVPEYVLSLPVPVITVSAIAGGYSVAYTTPSEDVYDAIEVVEYESSDLTEPTGVTYVRTFFDSINPANVITNGSNKRWVKARFSSDAGIYTAYSAAQAVTPLSSVTADNEGPPDITSLTTSGGIDSKGTVGFNGYVDLSWGAITAGDIRGYRIRYRPVSDPESNYSYADSKGPGTSYRLHGLSIGATYEVAVATYDQYNNLSSNYFPGNNVEISGTPYIASETVDVSGYFKAKANASDLDSTAFRFGYGIQDSGPSQRGLRFNTYNYWRIDSAQSASIRVGGEDSNYIYWNGGDFLIDGNISARKGNFSGNVSIAGGGSLQSFSTPPTVFSIDLVTYTATTATYRTTADHGYAVGDDILISGLLPEGYNGKFTITTKAARTFTVANTTNIAPADTNGSVIKITGTGFILNKDGITFNSSTTKDITTIRSSDGLFTTKSANIGGWNVNPSSISRTGAANISLDSSAGNISVSSQNIAGYTAGVNGPYISTGSTPSDDINGAPIGTENVFWAGSDIAGPIGTSHSFRVTLAGNLYASNAKITGTVSSVGALGKMTMDGEHGYMSLQSAGTPGGTLGPAAFLVPRNNNIYLTSPNPTEPWSTGKQIASSGPVNGPYIAAGSSFKDYWNNSVLADGVTTVKGVGLYTGDWDYFTLQRSDPFITASTTGIQLSVAPNLGLLLDKGSAATGDKLNPAIATNTPSMLFYTAQTTVVDPETGAAAYSPSTKYGAWAAFTSKKIKLVATENVFINIDGDSASLPDGQKIEISSTANIWQKFTSSGIKINAATNVWQQFDSTGIKINAATNTFISVGTESKITIQGSNQVVVGSGVGRGGAFPVGGVSAYSGPSKITLDPTYGVVITGIQVQRDLDMTIATNATVVPDGSGSYRGVNPLGRYPRSRMLIEDPVTGEVMLGMAVYYKPTSYGTQAPTDDTGYAGDLLVQY
jgi:hypothetical protein